MTTPTTPTAPFRRGDSWFWPDDTWNEHGPHNSQEDAQAAQACFFAVVVDGTREHVSSQAWEQARAREPAGTVHPCNAASAWDCDCVGSCACHWAQPADPAPTQAPDPTDGITLDPAPMVIVGGRWVHVPPRPEEVESTGILASLELVPRWNGLLGPTCNVAAHTYALVRWMQFLRACLNSAPHPLAVQALSDGDFRDLLRYGLRHDWHEAFTGDIVGPVKKALREEHGDSALDVLQGEIDDAIRLAGETFPRVDTHVGALGKRLDSAICSAEALIWEMHPSLLPRVLHRHGPPDPWAIVACMEAKRLASRAPDPIARALGGDEALTPLGSALDRLLGFL